MLCRKCNYPDSKVVETTKDDRTNVIFRRRECVKCGTRYTTQEDLRGGVRGPNYKTPPPNKILEK